MGELDKWTSEEFKKAENDLLNMKKRREEIPRIINENERTISTCQNRNIELENQIQQLGEERLRGEDELKRMQYNYEQSFNAVPIDDEMKQRLDLMRRQMQVGIANKEASLAKIRESITSCSGEIRKNEETIRLKEIAISDLKEEDRQIVEKCREYVKIFQDVETKAEKAIQTHTVAGGKFSHAGLSRFGKNENQNGQNLINNIIEKYKKKKELAIYLGRLALAIIQGNPPDSDSASAVATSGKSGNSYQDVMDKGYGGMSTSSSDSGNELRSVPLNPDGTTDFSTVSASRPIEYNPTTMDSADYLDEMFGETMGLSRSDVTQIRKDSGLVWRVEGSKLYMISKGQESNGSSGGYTIPENTHKQIGKKR